MKKWGRWLIVLLCLAAVGCGVFAASAMAGKRPYRDLTAADILSATVLLAPPDTTLEIPDTAELAEYLNQLVIYGRDDSYTEYAGQAVLFTLHLADGSTTDVVAYNPFLVIDGVGYRTKYEPCEALNRYANELLDSGEAVVVLEKPPALTVVSDNTAMEALLGATSGKKRWPTGQWSTPLPTAPIRWTAGSCSLFWRLRRARRSWGLPRCPTRFSAPAAGATNTGESPQQQANR